MRLRERKRIKEKNLNFGDGEKQDIIYPIPYHMMQ